MQYIQITPSVAREITLDELYEYHADRDDRRRERRARRSVFRAGLARTVRPRTVEQVAASATS